jgi:WKF domain
MVGTDSTDPSKMETPLIVKKKGKKRKVSKHILDAKMKHATTVTTETTTFQSGDGDDVSDQLDTGSKALHETTIPTTSSAPTTTNHKKQKTNKEKKEMKDPVDVEGYLLAWQQQEQQSDQTLERINPVSDQPVETKPWKFHKNTQSWLIRHLYDSTKISKHTFIIAVQYFSKSNVNVQERLRQDAMQRATQYQQQQQQVKEITRNDDNGKEETNPTAAETNQGNELEKNQRKAYKRARKVLETLLVANTESTKTL